MVANGIGELPSEGRIRLQYIISHSWAARETERCSRQDLSEALHSLDLGDLKGLQLCDCIACVVLASSQNLLLY